MSAQTNPIFVEVNGRLYQRISRDELPLTEHYLPSYKQGKGSLRTTCGREIGESGTGNGTTVKHKVTCQRCRKLLGLEPFKYPQAKL